MPADRSARTRPRPRAQSAPAAAGAAAQLGMLPQLLGYRLRLAQRAVFDDFNASMADTRISPGLFGVLVIIEANPGLKQSELAQAAQLDRSSIVPVVDKLEARALVERRDSQRDRRVNGLWLTARGAALLSKLKRRVLAHEQRVAHALSERERAQLFVLLSRIAALDPPPRTRRARKAAPA